MQQRFSTCNATMLRYKLQQFVARITSPSTYLTMLIIVERKKNLAKCDVESVKRMRGEYDILGPFLALMTTF